MSKRSCDLEGGDVPTVGYHSAKFGGHRYCGSGDMFLYLSRDYITKKSRDFEVWVPPTASCYSAKFGCYRYCGSPDIRFYICKMITWSKCQVTWWMLFPALCHHRFTSGGFMPYGKEDVIFPVPILIPIPILTFENYKYSVWSTCIWVQHFLLIVQNKDLSSIFQVMFCWPYI